MSSTPNLSSKPGARRNMAGAARRRARWVLCCLLAAALPAAAWYGWRWYTTPAPPAEIVLGGTDAAVNEAIEAARQEVCRQPRSAAAWGHLGLVLRAHDERIESGRIFAQAERLDPTDPRWPYQQGLIELLSEPEKALPQLRRAVELCRGKDAQETAARLRLGETLLENGQLHEAEEQFSAAQALAANDARLEFDEGLLAEAQGDLQAAREHLTLAVVSPFCRQKACIQLAMVCKRLGEDRAAAEYSRQGASGPPDVPWPDPFVSEYMGLAVGRQRRLQDFEELEAQGRLPQAIALLREIVQQYPDSHSYLILGMTLAKAGALDEAEGILRSVVRMAPEKGEACYFLGLTLYSEARDLQSQAVGKAQALAKFREAAQWEREAVRLKPNHGFAYLYLGLALREVGESQEGLAALREAVQRRPEFADTHLSLGEALAAEGQLARARACLETAQRLAPADPRPREALARLAEKEGKKAKAGGPK
jgi:tetratricopeptide (TPR) repeat protein